MPIGNRTHQFNSMVGFKNEIRRNLAKCRSNGTSRFGNSQSRVGDVLFARLSQRQSKAESLLNVCRHGRTMGGMCRGILLDQRRRNTQSYVDTYLIMYVDAIGEQPTFVTNMASHVGTSVPPQASQSYVARNVVGNYAACWYRSACAFNFPWGSVARRRNIFVQ
jgi:hypothetical protein